MTLKTDYNWRDETKHNCCELIEEAWIWLTIPDIPDGQMFIVVLNQRRKCESEWKLCEPEITLIAENLNRLIRSDVDLH